VLRNAALATAHHRLQYESGLIVFA
jgi:hypothetical protein